MFKIFIKSLSLALISLAALGATAHAQMEMPKPSEKKGMQSKSFGNQAEIEKLREMAKHNQPGQKSGEESASSTENVPDKEEGATEDAPESPEGQVWKQYKAIAGDKEPAKESAEKPEDNEEDKKAESEAESNDDIMKLLKEYKNQSKSDMSSRSFARPEDIEKSLQNKQEPKAEKEESAIEKAKAEISRKAAASAKNDKEKNTSKSKTATSYNN